MNKVLVNLRESRHMTKAELAEKLGISPSAISAYELGTRVPRDEVKIRIADFYGVSVVDIFYAQKGHET